MTHKRELYRDPAKGKIAGVCAGFAAYFGMEVWLVRILVITAALLGSGPFFFVAYVAAWFILDKKPSVVEQVGRHTFKGQGKGWYNVPEEARTVEVKTKVWQSGESAKQACQDIKQHYTQIEQKLRNMETYVTTTEFQLNREINKL
ncbi:envelope stress response membrane protein PspC [Neptunicella sp. SCSIO 80796]|uniref:envelope stress response membrane protein PspC n=1 Tax=Neptunicella plasticusilytica TaxID=3117012 RepID=UPI003A4E419D